MLGLTESETSFIVNPKPDLSNRILLTKGDTAAARDSQMIIKFAFLSRILFILQPGQRETRMFKWNS